MHYAVLATTANSLESALDLFRSQVVARESCESQCDAWNEWFSDVMRDCRRESGARATATAERMKISRSYLAMLESGKRRWSEQLIRKYFEAVGVGRG